MKGSSLTRLEKAGIFVAIGASCVSLPIAAWSAWTTNAYSELTSKPHVRVYPAGLNALNFDQDSRPDRSSRITCKADFRLVNVGGAGSVLQRVEVQVQIGEDSAMQGVDTITNATEAAGGGYGSWVGDGWGEVLFTAYTDRDFPVLMEPYGVFDLSSVFAELGHSEREFFLNLHTYDIETEQLVPPPGENVVPVSVSYVLRFADGARESIPPRICTYVTES